MAVNLGWDMKGAQWNDDNKNVSISAFVSALPAIVLHPGPPPALPLSKVHEVCSCGNLCHTRMGSFIQRRPDLVQQILTPLYEKHLPRMQPLLLAAAFLHSSPASPDPQPTTAPPIPVPSCL